LSCQTINPDAMEREKGLSNVNIRGRMVQLVVLMVIIILGVLVSHLFERRNTVGNEIKTSIKK
jgi:hypothetical protein